MLDITYLGNSAFSVASSDGTVLLDPYLSENDECPWNADEVVERHAPDAVCVTHVAHDHVGDAADIAIEHGLPVVTEHATGHYLRRKGVPGEQITTLLWGMSAAVDGLTIRALEAHHASYTEIAGDLVSGSPLSFLVSHEGTTAYHSGDTSIFRDLETFGDLYDPDVAMINVGQARDAAAEEDGPVTRNIAELTTREAVLASRWIGSERVVPMHYLPDEREQFVEVAGARGESPTVVPLDPGESIRVE